MPDGGQPRRGTITTTYSAACQRISWIVAEITGHHTTTPLSESNTGAAATGTTLSIALASIAAGNRAIGTIAVRGNTAITVGANETELAEATSTAADGAEVRTQMEYGVDTTVNWSWTTTENNAGVAVEYNKTPSYTHAVIIS